MKKKIISLLLVFCFLVPIAFMFVGCGEGNPEKYALNLIASDENKGVVYGEGTYEKGEKVVIGATAKSGYKFSSWSDGNTNPIREIEINKDYYLTANFTKCLKLESVEIYCEVDELDCAIRYIGMNELSFVINGQTIKVFDDVYKDNTTDMYISKGLFSNKNYYSSNNRLKLYVEDNVIEADQTSLDVTIKSEIIAWSQPDKIISMSAYPMNSTISVNTAQKKSFTLWNQLLNSGFKVYISFNFA